MGKNEKIAILVLVSVALLSVAWSVANYVYNHTDPAPAYGGTYIEGAVGQPTYINPALAHQEIDQTLIKLVYSGLYTLDTEGNVVPDLAAAMPVISDDQKQYTVELKKDIVWHNEKPFTADDVIFTLQIIKDSAFHSPLRMEWQSTNVEKLNDYSIKFTTKDVSGPFLSNLTLPILPKYIWGKQEAKNFTLSQNNLEAIGTGPYMIQEIKKLASGKIQQITLESFSQYKPQRPLIEKLIIKFYDTDQDLLNAFHSKEIHGLGYISGDSNVKLDERRNNIILTKVRMPHYQVIFFNFLQPELSDLRVRKALWSVSDRQYIVDKILKGRAFIPYSPLVFASQQATLPTESQNSLEEAGKLLDQAGWKIDASTGFRTKKNQTLELTLSTNDTPANSKVAEYLAEQWRLLGIKITLRVLPTNLLTEQEIKPRAFQILLFNQRFSADPDSFAFWHSSQSRDPGLNLSGFENPQADKLITEARNTTNRKIREQKYLEFNQLFSTQIPAFFLTQAEYVYAADSDIKNVTLGIMFEPNQRFTGIAKWNMAEKRIWK